MDPLQTRLLEIVPQLPAAQAETLLEFAEFLMTRYGVKAGAEKESAASDVKEIPPPLDIPRPAEESVVKAIKRLRATYPMLDARKLLNETSDIVTQHIMQGREAREVIEELETLFRSHYEQLVGNQ